MYKYFLEISTHTYVTHNFNACGKDTLFITAFYAPITDNILKPNVWNAQKKLKQESPPALPQEAYRPRRSITNCPVGEVPPVLSRGVHRVICVWGVPSVL